MAQRNFDKIVPKHEVWWRHGKHKGGVVIATVLNKQQKKRKDLEAVDTSRPDWTTRKGKR